MARARVRITRWNPRPFLDQLDGALRARMEVAAGLTAADVKKRLSTGGGSPHTPSRPGEPPRVDTGGLRRSVQHSVVVERGAIRGYVTVDHPAARALELGNPRGNLLPRPYLRPSLAAMQPTILRILLGRDPRGYLSLGDIRDAQARGLVARATTGGTP